MKAENKAEIEGKPSACCACLSVEYDPEQIGEGVTAIMRSRWKCQSCGREFAPKMVVGFKPIPRGVANMDRSPSGRYHND